MTESICSPLCPFVACETCPHQSPRHDDPPLFEMETK